MPKSDIRSLSNFNSTMVRLKGPRQLSAIPFYRYFNSTMVRLKGCRPYTPYRQPQFQFHYGSIKSWII